MSAHRVMVYISFFTISHLELDTFYNLILSLCPLHYETMPIEGRKLLEYLLSQPVISIKIPVVIQISSKYTAHKIMVLCRIRECLFYYIFQLKKLFREILYGKEAFKVSMQLHDDNRHKINTKKIITV